MKIKLIALLLLVASVGSTKVAIASPASDSLGTCMIDSLSGKERKQLAQWFFFAMSAHPDIKEYSKVSVEIQKSTNEYVGKLVTRLLAENCSEQLKLAAKEDGPEAVKGAFELVGKVALQELMANKDVAASISDYAKFVDNDKITAVLKDK